MFKGGAGLLSQPIITRSALLAYALSPPILLRDMIKAEPDKWQSEVLLSKPKQTLLLCSRQAGKSTVSSALALHKAIFKPNSLVLIVSKALRQAEELFRKVRKGLDSIPGLANPIRENQTMIELDNGSRIISLPGNEDSIRSYSSVDLLIIDEAAQVSDSLYAAVRPMTAVSGGDILALTTPYGKRGWFYRAWSKGRDWHKVKVTADDCPRISDEFLVNEKMELGEWWVKQEYYCEFVDSEDQLFNYDLLIGAISSDIERW